MKKIFFIFSLLFLAHSNLVSADVPVNTPAPEVYVFHLWYDNGSLRKDSAFDFPFNQELGKYEAVPVTSIAAADLYLGKIISTKGATLATFNFYLTEIARTGKGALTIKAPYFSNAQTAVFSNPSGLELLTIDLALGRPLCNEDGICDANLGENHQNCQIDCTNADINLGKDTEAPLKNSSSNQTAQSKITFPLIMLILIGGILGIIILFILYKKFIKE